MGILIDTSVFVAVERGQLDFEQLQVEEEWSISVVTLFELQVGAELAQRRATRERAQEMCTWVTRSGLVLDVTPELSAAYAALTARLIRQGKVSGAFDRLIAATALHHNLEIATLDISDFDGIKDLRLVDFRYSK